MSYQKREALVERVVELQPVFGKFVKDAPIGIEDSWDGVSYSFEKGFEAMWDLAVADRNGLLERPLLSLWRQSIELAIKSAILEIADDLTIRFHYPTILTTSAATSSTPRPPSITTNLSPNSSASARNPARILVCNSSPKSSNRSSTV